MKNSAPLILLAAGGTGGHMFPAEALAEALLRRGCRVVLCTDARGKGFGGRQPQVAEYRIASGGVAGKGTLVRLKNMTQLALGFAQSLILLRKLRPQVAVGFGGYPSVPPLLAARLTGARIVLHEQNATAGRANRFLARYAGKVALSFAQTRYLDALPTGKSVLTGNPVRPEIAALSDMPYRQPEPAQPFDLLVTGGSLGARLFGTLLPQAIATLPTATRARLRLVQQCRAEDMAATAAHYRALGLAVELQPFFSDMPARLAHAQLVICRAGASTVAELAAAGRPAIFIPLANAIDDHQRANAQEIVAQGGGWILMERAATPETLATLLGSLMSDSAALAKAAENARLLGRRDAAARLADAVLSNLPQGTRPAANERTGGQS